MVVVTVVWVVVKTGLVAVVDLGGEVEVEVVTGDVVLEEKLVVGVGMVKPSIVG